MRASAANRRVPGWQTAAILLFAAAGAGPASAVTEELWRADLGRGVQGQLAVAGERVYAATADRRVAALTLAGDRLWRARSGNELAGGVAADTACVLGVSDPPQARLICFDAVTGARRWAQSVGPAEAAPLVLAGRVFTAAVRGRITACEMAEGEILWQRPVPGMVRAPLAAAGGRLFVATVGDSVVALSVETGDRVWSAAPGGAVYGAPLVDGPSLWTLGFAGVLTRFDATTGAVLARGALPGRYRSGVVRTGDLLVAVDTSGRLTALGVDSLDVRWSTDLAAAAGHAPLADGERLWITLGNGELCCVAAADGEILERRRLHARPTTAPVRVGGYLLCGTSTGDVLALRVSEDATGTAPAPGASAAPEESLESPPPEESLGSPPPVRGSIDWPLPREPWLAAQAPAGPGLASSTPHAAPRLTGWGRVWAGGWLIGTGVALVLQREADHAHERYEELGDPGSRDAAFARAERYDRAALSVWVVSEGFFALTVRSWLRGGE